MERRRFLKKGFLGLAALMVMNIAQVAGSFAAVVLKVDAGKLKYKEKSSFPQKNCLNCAHYQERPGEDLGECSLPVMKRQMKADVVLVDKEGHCSMWAPIKK
jgi:hypothetical protein